MKNGTVAIVYRKPECDFGHVVPTTAKYDFRTSGGSWANGCEEHYQAYKMHDELGTGKGQKLMTQEEYDEALAVEKAAKPDG